MIDARMAPIKAESVISMQFRAHDCSSTSTYYSEVSETFK
jgi:hypothetical protein